MEIEKRNNIQNSTQNNIEEDGAARKEKKKPEELSPIARESSVGFILIFAAGWVNIQGLRMGMLDSMSYMTGRGVRIGTSLFEGDFYGLMYAVFTVIIYMTGSFIGAKITRKKGIGRGLICTALFLSVVAGVPAMSGSFVAGHFSGTQSVVLLFMLLSMGCMNGCTSLTKIGRTTHLTGTATDVGLHLALGNFQTSLFHMLRWIGFFMGVFVAMCFYEVIYRVNLPDWIPAVVPILIVGGEGFFLSVGKTRIPNLL